MPHSSGGGSHGGGSHSSHSSSSSRSSYSGSSSSGSSYSVDNTRVSRSYFEGANKYVYYGPRGGIHYLYADRKPTEPELSVTIIILLILSFFAWGILWFLLELGLYIPRKLDATTYPSGITILDEVGVLSSNQELENALQQFLDKTGVSPAVQIVEESTWKGYYTDLETFAYSEYLRLFDDEKHWLVTISLPSDYNHAEFVDWQWEGMIGDDCYPAFNHISEDLFTETIQRYLLRTDVNTMGDGLRQAYDSFQKVCMERQVEVLYLVLAAGIASVYVLLCWYFINDYIKAKRCHSAVRIGKNAKEKNCEYCGNLYVVGSVKQCPSCGAPIKASAEESKKKFTME